MIDLTSKSLPNAISVGGRVFFIKTDYRIWMKFVLGYKEWTRNGMHGAFDIAFIFEREIPVFEKVEDYISILEFAFPKAVVPHSSESTDVDVLYYEYDGDYIYSAFMQAYGIDLIEVKEMHWHKFHALLNGIPESTKLSNIMGYRAYTGEKNKDMDVQYRKIKESWLPPYEETEEDKQAEEEFNNFFG